MALAKYNSIPHYSMLLSLPLAAPLPRLVRVNTPAKQRRRHLGVAVTSSGSAGRPYSTLKRGTTVEVDGERIHNNDNNGGGRPLESFVASPWNSLETFSSNPLSPSELESYDREIELLKKEVGRMLLATASTRDFVETVRVIDVITRLGLSYHFEEDIEMVLNQMFESDEVTKALLVHGHDLFTVALLFRVFRQRGFDISCDVFEKFKGDNGRFREILSSDSRGLLSLYEAAFLSHPNEDILVEALRFTTPHLKSLLESSSPPPHLRSHIENALRVPLHKEIPRYGVHQFITFYEHEPSFSNEDDEEEEEKEMLLRFAKMDYNRLQDLYRREICECMRWWEKYVSKYPYARNRLVEMYLLAINNYFEPNYSHARIITTKLLMIYLVLDDTYDSYGTPMELECFTNQIQRWSSEAIDGVPDSMKSLYIDLLSVFDELNEELTDEDDNIDALSYVIDAVKEMCREFLMHTRTLHEHQVPTLDEYLKYRRVAVGGGITESTAFLGMQKYTREEFNPFLWLQSKPQLQTYVFTICSIKNDIASNSYEDKALQVPVVSAIECYMKQHECTRDKAIENLKNICKETWKDINKECTKLRIAKVPRRYVTILVNHARTAEAIFKDGEGWRRT